MKSLKSILPIALALTAMPDMTDMVSISGPPIYTPSRMSKSQKSRRAKNKYQKASRKRNRK